MDKIDNRMFNSAFSDFANQNKALNVNGSAQQSQAITSPVQEQSPQSQQQNNVQPVALIEHDPQKERTLDKVLKYAGLLSLVLVPGAVLLSNKMSTDKLDKKLAKIAENNQSDVQKQNQELAERFNDTIEKLKEELRLELDKTKETSAKSSNTAWRSVALLGGGMVGGSIWTKLKNGEKLNQQEEEELYQTARSHEEYLNNQANIAGWLNENGQISQGTMTHKFTDASSTGFRLISKTPYKTMGDLEDYDKVKTEIKNCAQQYMKGEAQKDKPPLKKGSTIWSVTAEFAPIKSGGLGSVPPDIQKNAELLGVHVPTFLPMYEIPGKSYLKTNVVFPDGAKVKYVYDFGGKQYACDKAAHFYMPVYRNGVVEQQPVEIYTTTKSIAFSADNKTEFKDIPQLVFVRNGENNKTGDYFKGQIYESNHLVQENEKFVFLSKAVYELEKAKLDPAIATNTGFEITNKNAFKSIKAPDAMLLNDWHAAPIAALSRYLAPCEQVSNRLSKTAADAIKNMRIVSICHNLDYNGSTHQVQNKTRAQDNIVSENMLNTMFGDFTADIVENANSGSDSQSISNVLVFEKGTDDRCVNLSSMALHLSDEFVPVSSTYAQEIKNDPEKSRYLQWAVVQRANNNTLNGIVNGNDYDNISLEAVDKKGQIKNQTGLTFEIYGKNTPIDEIMEKRAKNKINFYNNFALKVIDKTIDPKYMPSKTRYLFSKEQLPKMSDDELLATPILTNVGRIVSQKGIANMCNAIKEMYQTWDQKHPNCNKPIVYIGGDDEPDDPQFDRIQELLRDLPADDKKRVFVMRGRVPAAAMMAASDYFLMSSIFEPCGLTQGESFGQATPVIATNTGGIHDTISGSGENQNGVLTSPGDVSKDGFYNAMDQALDIFFNDKEKYKQMVENSEAFDQSWLKENRVGPIYEYMNLFGIKKESLPELSELRSKGKVK